MTKWWGRPERPIPPNEAARRAKQSGWIMVCCGPGGGMSGWRDAGERILAAIDRCPFACATARQNFPGVIVIEADIMTPKGRRAIERELAHLREHGVFGVAISSGCECACHARARALSPTDRLSRRARALADHASPPRLSGRTRRARASASRSPRRRPRSSRATRT